MSAIDEEFLFDAGEEDAALDWRGQRGDEEGMIPSGICTGDSAHGEAAGPISLEPFETGGVRPVAAGFGGNGDG